MDWYLSPEDPANLWYAAAKACGLANVRAVKTLFHASHVEANAGPLQVALSSSSKSDLENRGGSVIVTGVARELTAPASVGRGDPLPQIGGPALLRAALFDGLTRRLVEGLLDSRIERTSGHVEAFRCSVQIKAGVLFVTYEGPLSPDALSAVVEIARRLMAPLDLERAVVDTLRREADSQCRLNALRVLVQHAPEHPSTSEAAREHLADDAPEVRLEAALALGGPGQEVLQTLARSTDVPDHVSARALGALGRSLASDAISDVLHTAIERRRPLAAIACIEALGRRGPDEAPPLVQAVGHGDARIALAAAGALGRVGATAGVVVALREAESRHAADRAVRNAARAAVGAVQARLEGAEAGQLSVAASDAGRLALADDARGRVALDVRSKDGVQ